MANFIIINGSKIANIVVADNLEEATEAMFAMHMGNLAIPSDSAPEGWQHTWSWNGSELIPPASNDTV